MGVMTLSRISWSVNILVLTLVAVCPHKQMYVGSNPSPCTTYSSTTISRINVDKTYLYEAMADILVRECPFGCEYDSNLDCINILKECLFHGPALTKE